MVSCTQFSVGGGGEGLNLYVDLWLDQRFNRDLVTKNPHV